MRDGDDTLRNMRHTSDIIAGVLHEIATNGATDAEVLKTHPGKGNSNLRFGISRIVGHAEDRGVSGDGLKAIPKKCHAEFVKGSEMCESPIERNMLAALLTGAWAGFDAFPPVVHDCRKGSLENLPKAPVVIVPQLAFVRFRLDFGVVVVKNRKLQIVAVECDGRAYHQDPIKENERVAYLNSWDIPVFKIKGSALYEDAIREADRVIYGITEWRDRE